MSSFVRINEVRSTLTMIDEIPIEHAQDHLDLTSYLNAPLISRIFFKCSIEQFKIFRASLAL